MSLNTELEPSQSLTENNQLDIRCVFRHVEGFYTKYFEHTTVEPTDQLDQLNVVYRDFMKLKSEESFMIWLGWLQRMTKTKSHIQQIHTSDATLRSTVYFVAPSDGTGSNNSPSAADARAFGDFSVGASGTDAMGFSRLCETARRVFQARPTRMLLHGFQVCDSIMEMWVFDRSGAYSSHQFDMVQRPDLVVKVMTSYGRMNDEEAGFTSFIQRDDLGSYVIFQGTYENETKRLYLEDKPIAAPGYLVRPGTTCYAARAPMSQTANLVVKFAWREEVIHRERKLLELTQERKVWGVIKAFGWQDLSSIRGLREGLQFNESCCSTPTMANGTASQESISPVSSLVTNKDSDPPFIDRTFSCIVTSPLGRPINQFETITEFLKACRDVAKALRSLYEDGNILHRDICIKNLIIPVQQVDGEPNGVLIDLDSALELENGPARSGELVGSEGFMAIGILTGDAHTYRHDLESLFYVFLWVAICKDRNHDDLESLNHQPQTSRLWGWCSTRFKVVSKNKLEDMSLEGFPRILEEFSTEFAHLKDLARRLHQLLFPVRDGAVFTGTDTDEARIKELYDGVIGTFHEAISSLKH
ncbi:hypothetical protein NPX13_g10483 [Xylaria arbuscula]|uniref:non-specific serine/threonine protein kinase n=1 Tax=Xylaria arbuscula TaxID=114810 RepID=A0A9W8N4I9_9PEZI|nr:hypothetical protein NPX13_g10483 [Xylaria arbuscula]